MTEETNQPVKTKEEYDRVGKEAQDESNGPVLSVANCKLYPVHLACLDSDDVSPNHKLVQIKNNIASATNGSVRVKCDLTLCSNLSPDMIRILNGKFLHRDVWALMSKCEVLYLDDSQIAITNNSVTAIYEYSQSQGEFFDIDLDVQMIKEAGEVLTRMVCYNTKHISLLSKILQTDHLHFSFSKDGLGTIVFSHYDCGAFGIIAPEVTEEKNRYFFL